MSQCKGFGSRSSGGQPPRLQSQRRRRRESHDYEGEGLEGGCEGASQAPPLIGSCRGGSFGTLMDGIFKNQVAVIAHRPLVLLLGGEGKGMNSQGRDGGKDSNKKVSMLDTHSHCSPCLLLNRGEYFSISRDTCPCFTFFFLVQLYPNQGVSRRNIGQEQLRII